MKEKYIQERFGEYFTFGERNGKVDVASMQRDSICTVTPEEAETLIKDRRQMFDMLCKLASKLDEIDHKTFSDIWYN